ncbi:glycosyltransferase family 4 protein [Nitrolancea hollandica]|nr:glycosyltransferase family 4 protein [Nitrolancea hollandica]
MKLALITPEVISRPAGGGQMRLFQLQVVLSRIAQGNIVTWDLNVRGSHDAVAASQVALSSQTARTEPVRHPLGFLRDVATLALHQVPSFSVRALDDAQRDRLLAWIDREKPTHAVVIHPCATDLVPMLRLRGIKVFIDCQNVESDLARQLITLARDRRERLSAIARWRVVTRWEERYFPLAEEVWLPSTLDTERQRHVCAGRVRVRCVPNALDLTRYDRRSGGGTHDIVLPAYFGYLPNAAAARLLRDQVLPAVQQAVPDARLVLVGRDKQGRAQALAREPDVVVTGEVPDTLPYLEKAGVVAVPILQGGGTRYKILEAIALGLPVVTTPLGCEGLGVRDGEHLLVRDIGGFADAIVSIFRNPDEGQRIGASGRRLVEAKYSWQVVEKIIRTAMASPEQAGVSTEPVERVREARA